MDSLLNDDHIEAPRATSGAAAPVPLSERALDWGHRVWRTAGTGVVIVLILALGWHVVNGKHGLSVWEQNRTADKQLRKEIDDLQQENSRLRIRVEKLKSDPEAIEHEAREKLHYARPGDVIVDLPADPGVQSPGSAK